MKNLLRSLCAVTLTALMLSALVLTASCKVQDTDTGNNTDTPSDTASMELVRAMGLGWNLGNTLEACGTWIESSSISKYETAWGNPLTTKAMIQAIADNGFGSVRIPVAWSNMMGSNYTIEPALLARVAEVAGWVQDCGMVAIVNIHWDSGWFAGFSTNYTACMEKYVTLWTRISDYFKDHGLTLVFESLNEEGCWNDLWNSYGSSTSGKAQAYGILNNINQTFVDTVRASGGNNPQRHLLLAGYGTDIGHTCDVLWKLPRDPAKRYIVSVHYYSPSTFAILEEDASWGKAAYTWGSAAEIQTLQNDFAKLTARFVSAGIPVILGEYGCPTKNKDPASVILYLSTVCETALKAGICPMLWDAGGHFNRNSLVFNSTGLIDSLKTLAATYRP